MFAALRARLDADALATPSWPANPYTTASAIVDNLDTARIRIVGEWTVSTSDGGKWLSNYLHDGNTGKGGKYVLFCPATPLSGDYTVSTWHSVGGTRATNAPVWVFTQRARAAALAVNAYARSDTPDVWCGNEETLVGRAGSGKYFRGFLGFDLADLPAHALVDDVTLSLTIRYPDAASVNETAGVAGITVHNLDEPFSPGAVTWNSREAGTPWTTPGGTFATNVLTAIADPDGDGSPNREECERGTDPLDPRSRYTAGTRLLLN